MSYEYETFMTTVQQEAHPSHEPLIRETEGEFAGVAIEAQR
jgi:hypothetical protein